ncbi:MAG: hypothetical protein SX243_02190 [Acidobacteriota bacterium]|nr:hypothetical protein [Acidobacteriota bacterium]
MARKRRKETALEDKLRSLLEDFSRVLNGTMEGSSMDVEDFIRRLRSSGYALFLTVDRKRREDGTMEPQSLQADIRAVPSAKPSAKVSPNDAIPVPAPAGRSSTAPSSRAADGGEPRFQINAQDLQFLRSIGIDPTRRLRTRRRRAKAAQRRHS